MRKFVFLFSLVLSGLIASSFIPAEEEFKGNVRWYTFEEAVEANKKVKKKFMVDIYTDWCGWCKRMDANTFEKEDISAYLNDNFYPVKLDAEMKADVLFKGHTFNFIPNAGRRGVHTLAYSLLDGKMSYPSIVFLDEKVDRIMVSKGYKGPEDFMKELKFTSEEHYKETNLATYKAKAR
ncbi:MAG: DUF255 domain-containing protein [Saprospiraceae bacterium]|nr:DUF255 domain-containing protein [Saprospiraceae bacterium]